MTVRSARLFGPLIQAAGAVTIRLACPAGKTIIIKRVTAVSISAGLASEVTWYIGGGATSNLLGYQAVPGSTAFDRETWWVLEPGDNLWIRAGAATGVAVSGHGAILSGVA